VAAAWTKDRTALTVAVVNPTETAVKLPVEFKGVGLSGKGRLWCLTGPDRMAYNEPGKELRVRITEGELSGIPGELELPPISVSLYELPVK